MCPRALTIERALTAQWLFRGTDQGGKIKQPIVMLSGGAGGGHDLFGQTPRLGRTPVVWLERFAKQPSKYSQDIHIDEGHALTERKARGRMCRVNADVGESCQCLNASWHGATVHLDERGAHVLERLNPLMAKAQRAEMPEQLVRICSRQILGLWVPVYQRWPDIFNLFGSCLPEQHFRYKNPVRLRSLKTPRKAAPMQAIETPECRRGAADQKIPGVHRYATAVTSSTTKLSASAW